jgi:cytochrome c oxidase subunit 2
MGLTGVFPGLKDSPVALGDVAKHIDILINGVSGTAMAAYGPQMNDADIAAVVTYERNAWGNDTGDIVQPADIKAAR